MPTDPTLTAGPTTIDCGHLGHYLTANGHKHGPFSRPSDPDTKVLIVNHAPTSTCGLPYCLVALVSTDAGVTWSLVQGPTTPVLGKFSNGTAPSNTHYYTDQVQPDMTDYELVICDANAIDDVLYVTYSTSWGAGYTPTGDLAQDDVLNEQTGLLNVGTFNMATLSWNTIAGTVGTFKVWPNTYVPATGNSYTTFSGLDPYQALRLGNVGAIGPNNIGTLWNGERFQGIDYGGLIVVSIGQFTKFNLTGSLLATSTVISTAERNISSTAPTTANYFAPTDAAAPMYADGQNTGRIPYYDRLGICRIISNYTPFYAGSSQAPNITSIATWADGHSTPTYNNDAAYSGFQFKLQSVPTRNQDTFAVPLAAVNVPELSGVTFALLKTQNDGTLTTSTQHGFFIFAGGSVGSSVIFPLAADGTSWFTFWTKQDINTGFPIYLSGYQPPIPGPGSSIAIHSPLPSNGYPYIWSTTSYSGGSPWDYPEPAPTTTYPYVTGLSGNPLGIGSFDLLTAQNSSFYAPTVGTPLYQGSYLFYWRLGANPAPPPAPTVKLWSAEYNGIGFDAKVLFYSSGDHAPTGTPVTLTGASIGAITTALAGHNEIVAPLTSNGLALIKGNTASPINISPSNAPFQQDWWGQTQGSWTYNGAKWIIAQKHDGSAVSVYSSTNDGASWTAQNTGSQPSLNGVTSSQRKCAFYWDGTSSTVQCGYTTADNGSLALKDFTMGNSGVGTWGTARAPLDTSGFAAIPNLQAIKVLPSGDVAIFYDQALSLFQQRFVAGTWQPPILLTEPTGATPAILEQALLDPNETTLHLFYGYGDMTWKAFYQPLTGTALGTVVAFPVDAAWTAQGHAFGYSLILRNKMLLSTQRTIGDAVVPAVFIGAPLSNPTFVGQVADTSTADRSQGVLLGFDLK